MLEKLIGNKDAKDFLNNAVKSNIVSNSYMFVGTSGIGKKIFAKEFAKENMCLENGKCNDSCDSCVKINGNSNPDFYLVTPDGNSIKIDQIRKLQEDISKKPTISNRKVYIIDNADLMSEESQNCLLKTLEEPPEYAIIILIVTNDSKMLPTIKSRCVILKFKKIADDELKNYLPDLNDEQIKLLDGSFENLENIEEKTNEFEEMKRIASLVKQKELVNLLNGADILYNGKDKINEFLNFLNLIFFNNGMIECVEFVEKTKEKLRYNNNYEMCIDNLLMNCWKVSNK